MSGNTIAKIGMIGGTLTAAAAQAGALGSVLPANVVPWVSVAAAIGALLSALAHSSPVQTK